MKIHHFESTGEAYDACQWRDDISKGDILIIKSERVVGIADTWPVAVTENCGNLHAMADIAANREHFGDYVFDTALAIANREAC